METHLQGTQSMVNAHDPAPPAGGQHVLIHRSSGKSLSIRSSASLPLPNTGHRHHPSLTVVVPLSISRRPTSGSRWAMLVRASCVRRSCARWHADDSESEGMWSQWHSSGSWQIAATTTRRPKRMERMVDGALRSRKEKGIVTGICFPWRKR